MFAIGLEDATVQNVRMRGRGERLRFGDEGVDAARTVWTGRINKLPAPGVGTARSKGVT
jgi:hypothetical protein